MKILLGAHSVGKTTLLQEVHRYFPEYFITDGFSRPVIRISKKMELTEEEIQTAINELTIWGYENYLNHSKVISARSIIDSIIYTQVLNPSLEDDVVKMLYLFINTVNKIDYIFYIPIEFGYVDDGERGYKEVQQKIDLMIQDFIQKYIPKEKVVIIKGTVEERFNTIKQYL